MPRLNASNNAYTTLDGALAQAATSLTLADATGFPDAPFRISINNEIIEVGARTGTACSSLLRGRESTADVGHDSGAAVEVRWTAGMLDELDPFEASASAPADTTKLWIDTSA